LPPFGIQEISASCHDLTATLPVQSRRHIFAIRKISVRAAWPGIDASRLPGGRPRLARWHELIADPTIGDAVLDRVVHRAHRIELKGPSLRKLHRVEKRRWCGRRMTIAPLAYRWSASGRRGVEADDASREMLHRDLQGAVYENFSGGNYDTAVRDAYVQVEIAVREAVKPPASLVGVKLMREGFSPNTGKLANMALVMSERERMADLFAGAIGTFKNPLSHRKVGNIDPKPVIEELMFASRLLRFVKPLKNRFPGETCGWLGVL
jgi:uncharacterized protein (TIGR02391 family)